MKNYHILFSDPEKPYISSGEIFQAENEIKAIESYREKYPDYVFLGLHSEELTQIALRRES